MTVGNGAVVLEGVSKVFEARAGLFGTTRRVHAVNDVSLTILRGEAFALVGESGSGKTTLVRLMAALLPPTAGRVLFDGKDLSQLGRPQLEEVRRSLQVVFQDPVSALDPRQTVSEVLGEVLKIRGGGDRRERQVRMDSLLRAVDLSPDDADRYPHELSGGQCQRVGIARALVTVPTVLVADEPVAQLDVSTQAQIVSLLGRLRSQMGLTLVLVAHDLSIVRQIADRVAVMLGGMIVEWAASREIFSHALHPYTRSLLEAVPRFGRRSPAVDGVSARDRGRTAGAGCPFAPRCPVRRDACLAGPVELAAVSGPDHRVRCIAPEVLEGPGMSRDRAGD